MSESRPKKCSHCTKPCTLHLTQIMGGEMQKVDMCSTCPMAVDLDKKPECNLLSKVGSPVKASPLQPVGLGPCPQCGLTQSDFKEQGRLGCSYCYTHYADKLSPVIEKLHEGTSHLGKVPKQRREALSYDMILKLKERLQEHVEREEFEEAAVLRDRIERLEQR